MNSDPSNSFKRFPAGGCCEKTSRVHVYIRRACFAAVSCHCPSSLNITLEFHLKGMIHCNCGNFTCLMSKTRERDFLYHVPLYILSIILNMTWFCLHLHNAPVDHGGILSHFMQHLKVEGIVKGGLSKNQRYRKLGIRLRCPSKKLLIQNS